MAAHQPPAQPKAVLRGHQLQVHATAFVRGNQRLASGDADGYVVLWDLTTMRPTAVWRAHTNAILGIASWGASSIIT
jgi:ASTRA-associated protein 1